MDMAKITKKWPKPDKNEHEIVKSAQKPDPKTFLKESLTMEDVLVTLNSKELKKRTGDTKRETVASYVIKRSSEKRVSNEKSNGFVKKGKHHQDSDSSNEEGNTYFEEALVVGRNDEMTELVMNSGGSYHMTHKRDFLYDFKVVDGSSVQLGDNMTCTIKGIGKVKIQLHDGSRFILEDVSNDDAVEAQRWLEDKKLEEKTHMDCLVKEQEKVLCSLSCLLLVLGTTRDLADRSFLDLPFKADMSWGWLKLLQLRECIRPFFWVKLGNGELTLVWRAWEALRPRGNEVNWYHNVWFPHCIPRMRLEDLMHEDRIPPYIWLSDISAWKYCKANWDVSNLLGFLVIYLRHVSFNSSGISSVSLR
nr:retrovirus-related Pol polyprotein from transposon TNT 1-94 [Tanacetum cinerariifolium]